jgi:hypothetical protein
MHGRLLSGGAETAILAAVDELYVYDGGTLAEAADAVASAIGMPLLLRDSSFYGGDYYVAQRDPDEAILLKNYLEDDDEPFFQTQPVGAICVQVSGFDDARARLAAVPGLRRA